MSIFERFASWVARGVGHPLAFTVALLIVVVWAVCGPVFGYSDTWQLSVNTGTTIVTFLMVFLLANDSNRRSDREQQELERIEKDLEDR